MESAANLTTLDRKHDDLIVKVDWDREVTWDEVSHKLRVPKADVSTAATLMKQAFGIKRRTPRFKATRSKINEAERQHKPFRSRSSSIISVVRAHLEHN